ncbi:AMP-binding protein [Azoarcus sp. L1K30]|uniref:AMP-dependent synthetase/ligase n=1 Tax=Azoarcus sp. L1K30 TaxID=2820277 RepID=UPI001B842768|nr:AMP-binding protein [Azoarcus sp. L1K30]MBR0568473.1 AMP-binding protein [Azoarcus sp. L1K30]
MTIAPQTLPERLSARAQDTPEAVGYLFRDTSGSWQETRWKDVAKTVATLAAAFGELGLKTGDRVAIMLPTSPNWDYCHLAALACGAIAVGLDVHDAPGNLHHVLATTTPRAVIAADIGTLDALSAHCQPPEIRIVAEGEPKPGVLTLSSLLRSGSPPRPAPPLPSPDDTATIVFTSGSTGKPKGIAYSHRQILLACDALATHFTSIRHEARFVCWLPLSNLFQRILNVFALSCGASTFFVDRPEQLMRLLPEIRPTLFVGVPRFFEKLHAGIMAELDRKPLPVRAVANAAWNVGQRIASAQRAGHGASLPDRLLAPVARRILSPLRALMGPDLQFMASGSAPLPLWLMERFHGLGWLVLEAYGVSENVIPIAINTPDAYRFGSVGRPLPGNELVIAEDHELLVRGPGVSLQYAKASPTDSGHDECGHLHTGDYARIDEDGFVWLEGRKSEVFKTSTGRRVAPSPIEAELKKLSYVEHAIVVGQGRPFPLALLVISPQHPIAGRLGTADAMSQIRQDAVANSARFPDFQRPGVLLVTTHPFSVASGELTANLKLRRPAIEARFAAQIESAYRIACHSRQSNRPTIVVDP